MAKKNAKEFWEEHKAAIIATTTIVIGGVVSVVLHRRFHKPNLSTTKVVSAVTAPKKEIKLEIPEGLVKLGVTEWGMLTDDVVEFSLPYAAAAKGCCYPTKIKDLRDMVDAICDIPGITEESDVWGLISIGRDSE